jgi:DNA-binding LytR/AlgR family response regulator
MTQAQIVLPNGSSWDVVPVNEILFIEVDRKLCRVFTPSHVYLVSKSLQAMEARLPEYQFFRIHKSYLIAMRHVISISKYQVKIADRTLPVSRKLLPVLFKRFDQNFIPI